MSTDPVRYLSLVSAEPPDSVCLRAAEIVRERWRQGAFGLPGQARCLEGALTEAAGTPLYRTDARLKVACVLGTDELGGWNDTPGRSAEEVANALETAARLVDPWRFPAAPAAQPSPEAA